MFYNYYQSDEYQYDSCISGGVCSSDPTFIALQEVIVFYLKKIAFYTLKLEDKGLYNKSIENDVLKIIAGISSYTDYSKEQFEEISRTLYDDLIQSKYFYDKFYNENKFINKFPRIMKLFKRYDYANALRYGEKEFLKKQKKLSKLQKNLYEIVFILVKNIAINLILLQTYDMSDKESYLEILKILEQFDSEALDEILLKEYINNLVKLNLKILDYLEQVRNKVYGEPKPTMISFSTRPNKAILVSGTGMNDLEMVLKSVEGTDIDVYTHGSLLFVHTYPVFRKYSNLRGHFGYGVENCLLDFATFPGPILLTKNSAQNVEHIYRGRLFSTDVRTPKGVISIVNDDFQPLIDSALSAKGFAKGQERPPLELGFLFSDIVKKVDEIETKFNNGECSSVYILGIISANSNNKFYFNELLNNIPKDAYIVNLSDYNIAKNAFRISSFYDFSIISKLLKLLNEKSILKNLTINVFLSKCDKFVISNILNLYEIGVKNIFIENCSPYLVNPGILDVFKEVFGVKFLTTAQNDINLLL